MSFLTNFNFEDFNFNFSDIDEDPDLDEVAEMFDARIIVHTDLQEEPEREFGESELVVRLLELRDGEAYCTLTQKKRKQSDGLTPPKKHSVVEVDCPIQWELSHDRSGSTVMRYMVKVDPKSAKLETSIQQLHAFYIVHGIPKYEGIHENEAELARWMARIRCAKRKGISIETCDRIDREFPWWSWDPTEDAHDKTIQLMHAHYAAHGEPNSCSIHATEKRLATWITARRADKKTGLNIALCTRCEFEFTWWKWNKLEAAVEETIRQLHVFFATYGEPKSGNRENEKTLSAWVKRRRGEKKNGINAELSQRINAEFTWWKWDPYIEQHERSFQQMHEFYEAHGTPNFGGLRENEKKLATWISERRGDKKKGKNADLCARCEREFPWWKWDGRNAPAKRPKTFKHPTLTAHELGAPRPPTAPCDIRTDFNTMTMQQWHQKAFTMRSENLAEIFAAQPEAWSAYHGQRNEKMDYDPLDRIIAELGKARHQNFKVIADLGCGDCKLGKHFRDRADDTRYKIQGFDLVATEGLSMVCDVSRCDGLADDSVHIVVLCLGLWGTNKEDTLCSAHRILETNGVLYLVEPTRRWTAEPTMDEPEPEPAQLLLDLVAQTGFSIIKSEIKEGERILQFAYLKLVKT